MVAEATLLSFAILNINWETQRRSYIHNFLPFVADCIRRSDQDKVATDKLQRCLEADFGLRMPLGTLDTLLRAAARDQLVVRRMGGFFRNDKGLRSTEDVMTRRADLARQHRALIDRFVDYCVANHQVELSHDEAEDVIFQYLEARSLRLAKDLMSGAVPTYDDAPLTRAFLMSAFVLHVHERDPLAFGYLVDLVKGAMLASALYFSDPGEIERRFSDLRVFLDTNLLIHALGYHGETKQRAFLELAGLLRELGARILYFPQTLTETRRVLSNAMESLRRPRRQGLGYSTLAQFCAENGITAADLVNRPGFSGGQIA